MRVAAKSNVKSLAASISKNIRDGNHVELDAIGAGAVNQAIKAIAVASGNLAPLGYTVTVKPCFKTIDFKETVENPETHTIEEGVVGKSALCFILIVNRG
jgi:stage V sporulation protein S